VVVWSKSELVFVVHVAVALVAVMARSAFEFVCLVSAIVVLMIVVTKSDVGVNKDFVTVRCCMVSGESCSQSQGIGL